MQQKNDLKRGIIRWGARQLIFWLLLMLILMLIYGNFQWTAGWVFLIIVAGGQILNALILLPNHGDLLAERSKIGEGTSKRDIFLAFMMAYNSWFIGSFCAVDARNGWSPQIPLWLWVAAILLILAGSGFTQWAMYSNRFFSGVVRIQSDRGHQVINKGPYRIVRHPGYLGVVIFILMTPLVLKSIWGLLLALIFIALVFVRTSWEDETLREDLPGYIEYAKEVRYKLIPKIW
ncbi:MAG: isoprenylcysteine carboxyl methyltransferase [Anaerolineaceae bacterium]|nr:isoprenylcysteine carboxyl methyltransferase [Anaerolineaceae bacterium]